MENVLRVRSDRRDSSSRQQLLDRVRAEFVEMPCLRLTRLQAQRLFALRPDVCERVLTALVAERTLCRERDDRYRLQEHVPGLGTGDLGLGKVGGTLR